MQEQSFIVTIRSYEDVAPLTSNDVSSYVTNGLPSYSGSLVTAVRKYDPSAEARTSKIPAIKRVRTLLNIGLRDSKFLVDYAEKYGSVKWARVEVDYLAGEGFRVIDHS